MNQCTSYARIVGGMGMDIDIPEILIAAERLMNLAKSGKEDLGTLIELAQALSLNR